MEQQVIIPDLASLGAQESFLQMAGDWDLVTGTGKPVEVSRDLRRSIAVFGNGVAVIARGMRHTAEVKSVLDRARHAGVAFRHYREADVPVLLAIYERLDVRLGPTARDLLDLERQRDLARLFEEAAAERASDIHMRVLPTHTELKIRVNGRMRALVAMSPEIGQAMIRAAFAVASGQGATGTDSTFQQGALGNRSGLLPPNVEMIRLQYTPTSDQRGALVMRLKYIGSNGDTDVDALGYAPEQVADLRNMRLKTNGMYILAGKVSSGKTTTLQRCLNAMYVEKRGEISIYAAEDPKELELDGAIQAQISAGHSATEAFRTAMKAALRSDPNVIVLGEIRSSELAEMAMEAAKTGHALWSTVHAGSALGILNRLINLGVDREDLKDPRTVGGLIYQRLIGVMCRHCRVSFPEAVADGVLDGDLAVRFARLTGQRLGDLFVRGRGCPRCQAGLTGRTVVAETIRPDAALLEIYMDRSRLEAEKYWLAPREGGGLGGAPVLHHALAKAGAAIADINEIQEEVDLLETYEREFASLTDRLRRDIAVLRHPGVGHG
jgi:type II secretory ATPase GspE/PulE/Tfp pilus assembly ATPase PilB-like protein